MLTLITKTYFENIFTTLNTSNLTRLIIDLRGNDGGSPEVSNELFSWLYPNEYYYFEYQGVSFNRLGEWRNYLATDFNPVLDTTKERSANGLFCYTEADDPDGETMMRKFHGKRNSFKGNIVTIIDGGCYSTTGHFISLLKNYNIGKLFGNCSHGSYYSNDGGVYFKLPYTGLTLRIPVAQSKMRVSDFIYNPKGICPDIEVNPLPIDLKTGFDRQLDAALQFLK